MATVTYKFLPNDVVWHVDSICGISEQLILNATIIVQPTLNTITYTVRDKSSNVIKDVPESTLYANLSGVGSALEAYEALLLA